MMDLDRDQWDFVIATGQNQGVGDEALRKWRERDAVPWRWRPIIAMAAAKAKISLPAKFLLET